MSRLECRLVLGEVLTAAVTPFRDDGSVDGPLVVRILLAIGLPLGAAVLWGTFVAPKRKVQVSEPTRLLVELALFGAGALALVLAEHVVLGLAFGALALLWSGLARL